MGIVKGFELQTKTKNRWNGRLVIMKSISVALLTGGVVLLCLFSCATVPTEPLGGDELRLLSVHVPGAGRFRINALYTINVRYESGGQPKVQRMCYSLGNSGPHCAKVTGVETGLTGTFQMDITGTEVGPQRLDIYVEYFREGKLRRTNVISSRVELTK